MEIEWKENPFDTIIHLDTRDKAYLRLAGKEKLVREMLYCCKFYYVEKSLDLKNPLGQHHHKRMIELTSEKLEDMAMEQYNYNIAALNERHMGDCVCMPCTCERCMAESLLGIDTIKGLFGHEANHVLDAFEKFGNREDVLNHLMDYHPGPMPEIWKDEKAYVACIPRWRQEARNAYEWLLNYYAEKKI